MMVFFGKKMTFSLKFEPNLKKKKKSVARFMSEHGVYYFVAIVNYK